MPDWPTIQAAAANTDCKLVIRLPLPTRVNDSAYYFQLHQTNRPNNQFVKLIPTDNGECAAFHRFFANDKHKSGFGNSRLYNSILCDHWGFFLPLPANKQWYEYLAVNRTHWAFGDLWTFPSISDFSTETLRNDPQAIWGTKIPVPPPDHNETDQNETEYSTESDGALEEDDIFDSSDHVIDQRVASNLQAHAAAGTTTRTIISETLSSIFGSSISSGGPPNLEGLHAPQPEPLIQLELSHRSTGSDETSIPSAQRRPANINSPARPESDEWLQPPILQAAPDITPGPRPTTLTLLEFYHQTGSNITSTPMDRLALLHNQLKATGFTVGSSQHPITVDRNPQTQPINPKVLSDTRVRQLGIIDSQITNIENAIIRNNNKQSDGRPPVHLTGSKIQSPSPDLVLTDELLAKFNSIALQAMTKMSNMLIEAQLEAMTVLCRHKDDLLAEWTPDDQESAAAERIEASRTHKEATYKARPLATGRITYRLDTSDNGPAFLPSLEPTSTSGFRVPAAKNVPIPTRTRRDPSPPRDSITYGGARSRTVSRRPRPDPPLPPPRRRFENWDDDRHHDDRHHEEPRFDRYRNTRYFHQSPN